ncbi:MAG: hypothetical protein IM631_19430 [Cytophagales bacterium]|jgi:hypothetical protein|nr:hypothetical protein [Cytophagales bacterium]
MRAIESRLIRIVTYPFLALVGLVSIMFLYINYIGIRNNINDLFTLDFFPGMLFMNLVGLAFPILLAINKTALVFDNDQLRIKYLFGLITKAYKYKELTFNILKVQSVEVTVIQLDSGEQIRLSEKAYENYNDIKSIVTSKLTVDSRVIWRRQFTLPNKIFAALSFFILLTFVVSRLLING